MEPAASCDNTNSSNSESGSSFDRKYKAETAHSFVSRKFHPRRGPFSILSNCHIQTIVGSEAIRSKTFGGFGRNLATTEEVVRTPDGDSFDIEISNNIDNLCKGIVVVLHGLESNIKGPMVNKMAMAFIGSGFGCCLVSFRGCNGKENDTPGAYHLGFTKDVAQVVSMLNERYRGMPLYLSGFSLGGNVCLKFLGELGELAKAKNIR